MTEDIIGRKGGTEIQFLHANAYTPHCYDQMLRHLSDFEISLPYQRPLWPDADPSQVHSWRDLADDLIRHMDLQKRSNVIGIGHSLGGIISWLAAIKRPDLFAQLILIDPVILPRKITRLTKLVPMSIKERYVPIVKIASRRKDTWASREEAKKYFQSKRVFQQIPEPVLNDIIQFGIKEVPQGVTLAYPKKWEAWVYANPPYMWDKLENLPCPITICRAEQSDVIIDRTWQKITKRMTSATLINVSDSGHLLPFEQPEVCAKLIMQRINNNN